MPGGVSGHFLLRYVKNDVFGVGIIRNVIYDVVSGFCVIAFFICNPIYGCLRVSLLSLKCGDSVTNHEIAGMIKPYSIQICPICPRKNLPVAKSCFIARFVAKVSMKSKN